jgi:hypothetical protein
MPRTRIETKFCLQPSVGADGEVIPGAHICDVSLDFLPQREHIVWLQTSDPTAKRMVARDGLSESKLPQFYEVLFALACALLVSGCGGRGTPATEGQATEKKLQPSVAYVHASDSIRSQLNSASMVVFPRWGETTTTTVITENTTIEILSGVKVQYDFGAVIYRNWKAKLRWDRATDVYTVESAQLLN